MRQFLGVMEAEEGLDPKQLKVPMTREEVIAFLGAAYGAD